MGDDGHQVKPIIHSDINDGYPSWIFFRGGLRYESNSEGPSLQTQISCH